jgi:hypothetical protein
MSSNGFSGTTVLESLSLSRCFAGCILGSQQALVLTQGRWFLQSSGGRSAVLLLRHKSFWWSWIACISLQTVEKQSQVLWFVSFGQATAWRRMRVCFRAR